MADLFQVLRKAGVVGAGGAGFPTYVKAQSKAEIVLANGTECEPLLYKDTSLMLAHAGEMHAALAGPSLVALGAGLIGMWLGQLLRGKVRAQTFRLCFFLGLLLLGVHLALRGVV